MLVPNASGNEVYKHCADRSTSRTASSHREIVSAWWDLCRLGRSDHNPGVLTFLRNKACDALAGYSIYSGLAAIPHLVLRGILKASEIPTLSFVSHPAGTLTDCNR